MTTDDISWRARSVECPKCHAPVGQDCVTPLGRTAKAIHSARTNPWLRPQPLIEVLAPPKTRLPKKLRYKVRDRSHVWCDHHGAVHPSQNDYFDEGSKDCYPLNWRRVYIESDDKQETF